MKRKRNILLIAAAAVAAAVLIVVPADQEPVTTSGNPGLTRPRPDVVLQGIQQHHLPPEIIPADFLWGAGKFAVFEVHAPPAQDLLLNEVVVSSVGADDVLKTVWLRMNRERIYAETAFAPNELRITAFPVPNALEETTEDVVLSGEVHRVMVQAAKDYRIPAGESVVVEIFGNVADDAQLPKDVSFCLLRVSGVLADGKTAQSSLNETCWNAMTVVPAT